MIKKYKEYINEGILDLLSGYSMDEVKEKLNHLTPVERYKQLKKLNLTYQDVYTQEEINNFTGLEKNLASNNYDWVSNFYLKNSIVNLNYKWGVIDINGKTIIPIKYDNISVQYNMKLFNVILNKKHGIIDFNGKEIVPVIYDYIKQFTNDVTTVRIENKMGVIDSKGNTILPTIYDYISINNDEKNIFYIENNGKTGYIDIDGNENYIDYGKDK